MSGKNPLHWKIRMNAALTDSAVLARDLAQWLEDREAASVTKRPLARANLERRHGIPRGVFWSARHRVRESLSRWLDELIDARVQAVRSEVHELETTLATARALGRPGLAHEIEQAEASLADARTRLAALDLQPRR